jgi:large subunit ribosomal protein L31e
MVEKKGGAARKEEVVTREYTINLHKRLHGWYTCVLPFHPLFCSQLRQL